MKILAYMTRRGAVYGGDPGLCSKGEIPLCRADQVSLMIKALPKMRPVSDDSEAINDTPFEAGYDNGWNACVSAFKAAIANVGGAA